MRVIRAIRIETKPAIAVSRKDGATAWEIMLES